MSLIPTVDYHTHTPLCGHAAGEPEAYVERALAVGLQEIGFSDHAPLVSGPDPRYTMKFEELPVYHRMMDRVRNKFPQFTVKVGIEADYIPGLEHKTREILQAYPYDYVIGSVHFIDNWAFDDPDPSQMVKWRDRDIDTVYRDYYRLLRRSAESGLFDIMGHVDLVKKFGYRPASDIRPEIEETARVFKKAGVTVEINSSGLRKPVKEIYPSLDALRIYREQGIPITFSSDAHDPQDVGRDYDRSAELAKAAGYREYNVFKARRVERVERL